jgi:hypothetical protein
VRLQKISLMEIVIVFSIALTLFWSSLVFAKTWDVESLQKEIDARGYKWKAGKTSLSDLSLEEFMKLSSLDPCGPIYMMPAEERITLPDDFPAYLDWRNYKGGNWISPVKQQGTCGSCYAFASTDTLETLIRFHHNDPTLSMDLSEQYLVSCVRSGLRCDEHGYYGGCIGNYVDFVYDFLVDSGVPDEGCFPYKNIQWPGIEPLCTNACSDVDARVHKVSRYSFIGGDRLYLPYPENIKALLVNKPVHCSMLLHLDWIFYTGGIYEPIPLLGNISVGHGVQIIGYDDAQQCWICKNNQGTDWGETADFKLYTPGAGDGGYFRVAYVTSLEDTLTYFGIEAVDANYDGGPPIPTSTTTTISCPSEEIYGEGSEELELLRHFRDTVLNHTQEGKELIKLYYRWSPAIVKTMEEDKEFKENVKEMVDGVLLVIGGIE